MDGPVHDRRNLSWPDPGTGHVPKTNSRIEQTAEVAQRVLLRTLRQFSAARRGRIFSPVFEQGATTLGIKDLRRILKLDELPDPSRSLYRIPGRSWTCILRALAGMTACHSVFGPPPAY